MQHALDLDRGDGCALQRGQQNAPERIAERQSEAALERLGDERRRAAGIMPGLDLEFLRFDQFLPILLEHVLPHRFPDVDCTPYSFDGWVNA